jgi:SAM-dependent methyltransferase
MHDTALIAGKLFCHNYGSPGKVVLDIGGKNVYGNADGSLKRFFEDIGMKFICVDIEDDKSVDIVVKPGDKLPFEDGSVDLIVSTSCFEHDPCFWMTFKEMSRVLKFGGFIYVNAPTNGTYHCHPGDNWRFYSDAGQALAYWSGVQIANEHVFPVKVTETFHILPKSDIWVDFVCVWERVEKKEIAITISKELSQTIGILEKSLNNNGYKTTKKC